jgi:diguanylate cyclase (GGDEF)-like protein
VGDALLCAVAKRLSAGVRDGGLVCRIGGDEFAVLPDATGPHGATRDMSIRIEDARSMAERLIELLSRPFLVRGHLCNIGASVGIAVAPVHGMSAEALIRNADLALYQAKAAGRGCATVYHPSMGARAEARLALETELRRALALHQFELHYQPQMHLADRRIVGCEALLRWRHPERGLLSPDAFLPAAEEIGLIVPLGEWVLRTACRDAASWPPRVAVAVNVAPRQLADPPRFVAAVRTALSKSGLSPARLEIEITEHALLHDQGPAIDVLNTLRATGVRVSMDDFGTGYSSLSRLNDFPFDKIKIDRSFVSTLGDPRGAAVLRAIAALGTSLGMTTTAEGVETQDQEALVREDGCTDMQGYLLSRAMPAAEIGPFLHQFAGCPETVA